MNDTKIRKEYRKATALILRARAKQEDNPYVVLQDLYKILGAESPIAQNGVLWAIQDAKTRQLLSSTTVRGVYTFEVI